MKIISNISNGELIAVYQSFGHFSSDLTEWYYQYKWTDPDTENYRRV